MRTSLDDEETHDTGPVSTGALPPAAVVQRLVEAAHDRYRHCRDGTPAAYIPELAAVDPDLFGIALLGVDGRCHEAGDADYSFPIQSISKAFVFALVCEAVGYREARAKVGVNATGLPFDSVMAIELDPEQRTNALVNAGAIATASLAPGADAAAKWAFVRDGLQRFAGRELTVIDAIYEAETAAGGRNRGIARLLHSYDRLYAEPDVANDVYTRQCALAVTCHDLALMGATLADGGVNPVTGERVVSPAVAKRTLALMATAGLYEQSGDWLFEVGLPGKSGVGGGLVTVVPGKAGLAVFSPPLDDAGNSVRGQRVTKFLSERLGLNLFASNVAD